MNYMRAVKKSAHEMKMVSTEKMSQRYPPKLFMLKNVTKWSDLESEFERVKNKQEYTRSQAN